MQRGNAVDRETPHDRQIGHSDLGDLPLLDDRHAPHAFVVARPAAGDLLHETGIDFKDDLQQTWQQLPEQRQRPALQRFRQQRVVGVGHGPAGDLPGLLPPQPLLVHQNAHQFRHRAARMGIVQLEAVALGKRAEIALIDHHPAFDHVLQAGRSQEILLAQSQYLAVLAGIVRIEHHGDIFGFVLGGNRLGIVAGIELAQVEGVCRDRLPEPQRIDGSVAITGNRDVVRHGQHIAGIDPADTIFTVLVMVMLATAAEAHALGIFRAFHLPGIAVPQPVVRLFDLAAIDDALAEHAVFITQAIAHHRQLQRGAAVQKTGRQPPQAAVAQPGVGLGFGQFLQLDPQVFKRLGRRIGNAQVQHRIAQRAPHQEFQRQVIAPLAVGLHMGIAGLLPAFHQPVTHDQRQRLVIVVDRIAVLVLPQVIGEIMPEIADQAGNVHRQRRQLGQAGRMDCFTLLFLHHVYSFL